MVFDVDILPLEEVVKENNDQLDENHQKTQDFETNNTNLEGLGELGDVDCSGIERVQDLN